MEKAASAQPSRPSAALGFIVAPALPAAVIALSNLIGGSDRLGWAMAGLTAVMSYLLALIAGLPVHALLWRLGFRGLPVYLLVGALIGLFGYVCFYTPQIMAAEPVTLEFVVAVASGSRGFAMYGLLCGAGAAFVFWLISVKGKEPLRRDL